MKTKILLAATLAAISVLTLSMGSAASPKPDFKGHGAEYWHYRYVKSHKLHSKLGTKTRAIQASVRQLRKAYLHRPSSLEAIRLASIAYKVSHREMYAVAKCETGGTFDESADNPRSTASGLFQFLTSTFNNTPYSSESIWSPYANALAAGWLHNHGGGWRQWVCKP